MFSEVFGDDEACVGFEVTLVQITRALLLPHTPSTGRTYEKRVGTS